jgi:Tfp pilus assembly protein PilF
MSVSRPDKDRRLLPRWQPSAATITSGELQPVGGVADRKIDDVHFEARKAEWETTKSIEVAAELVGSGIVLGRHQEVEAAARLLADGSSDVSVTLRRMARRALGETAGGLKSVRKERPGRLQAQTLYAQVSRLRQYLRDNPRDAYAWIDIARLYTTLGQNHKAQFAIEMACAIAPNDRFVLRAASRFFVHIDEAEAAQRLLNKAARTKHDPWLMAAEIATAQVAGRPSQTAALANRALKAETWNPRSSSELAGSYATLLRESGAAKQSRGLFRQSLRDPTENAVAQAQWVASDDKSLIVPDELFNHPNGHEARTLRDARAGEWDTALDGCWEWAEYEPTSSRPTIMGSFIAAVAHEDAEAILEFAERGLAAEPENSTLLNNKAVGLALADRIDEAVEVMRKVVIDQAPTFSQPALFATTGLLFFRAGDPSSGRKFYEKAIDHQYSRSDRRCRALALWHLAREEVAAETTEIESAIAKAEKASTDVDFPEIDAIRERVLKAAKKPFKPRKLAKSATPVM